MNITPVLNAPFVIQLHLLAALLALGLGAVQLAAAKGTPDHRRLGYIWTGMMAVVALSSFFIFELRLWGPFQPDTSAQPVYAGQSVSGGSGRPQS